MVRLTAPDSLITERHVLTCAHVIGDATGADAAADAMPTEQVLVEFTQVPGRLLFTTRDTAITRAVGATCFEVTGLSIRESLRLLARWARLAVEELPREELEIAAECGYLALAMAMAGAMIAGRPERWPGVLRRLRQADLAKIAQPFSNYPYPDLLRAISVSIDALDPADRARYLELAVFDGRHPTIGAAQTLWRQSGLDDLDVAELLDRLAG
ncbi:NB-ARC domain-containing protein [Nocardia sp. CA-120079]|uniref:NB-ARC domain-containing protein n=1 Tax=Nocardia sp. CA-120079 TaxID=3239974 RepID=UPI003D963D0C